MADDEKDRLNDLLQTLRAGEPENLPSESAPDPDREETQPDEAGDVERVLNKMSEMAAAEPEADEPVEATPQPQPEDRDSTNGDTAPNLAELLQAVANVAEEDTEQSGNGGTEGDDTTQDEGEGSHGVSTEDGSEGAVGADLGSLMAELEEQSPTVPDAEEAEPQPDIPPAEHEAETNQENGDQSAPSLEALLAEMAGNEAEPQETEPALEPEEAAASEESTEDSTGQSADIQDAPVKELVSDQEAEPVVRVLGGTGGAVDAPAPKVELQTQQEIQKILTTMTLDEEEGDAKGEGDSILTKTELDSLSPDDEESADEEEPKDVLPMPQPALRPAWVSTIGALTALNSFMLLCYIGYSILHRPAVAKANQVSNVKPAAEIVLNAAPSQPADPSPVEPVNAFQQYMRTVQEADLLFKRGEHNPAATSYRKALLIRPENEPTDYLKFQVGCCYEKLQQHESAVAVFRQLLSEEFRSQYRLKTRYRIGECLFKAKHYGEARKAYYRAIALSARASKEDEREMLEDAYFKIGDCFRKEAELLRTAQSISKPAVGAYTEF